MPGSAAGIILAGGASVRMGFDKVWADLGGQPVLAWSVSVFASCAAIEQIVLVVRAGLEDRAAALLKDLGLGATVVVGGERRRDSVLAGLNRTSAEWVVVHDAARPLLTADLIVQGLQAAQETGAAIAAVRERDTIKRVVGDRIEATLDRSDLWAAQTPQVFRRSLLLDAHLSANGDVTDDAALLEGAGIIVKVYEGAYANIKVTTPADMQVAAALLFQPPAKPFERNSIP